MATGKRYNGFTNQSLPASATAPMFNIVGGTSSRVGIYEFNSGSDATPADQAQKFALQRSTVNFGTPTVVTPVPLDDPADPAAAALFSAPGGTAPTLTANKFVYQWAQNARANFRWIAAPDSEFKIPASAAAGLALLNLVSTATQNWAWSVLWVE